MSSSRGMSRWWLRFLKSPIPWTLWLLLVAIVTLGVALLWFPPPVHQPLTFNHRKHKDFGCVLCHEGMETRMRAGLPDIDICQACHDAPPVEAATEIAAWNEAVEKKQIHWKKLARVPSHAYFSHRRHVRLGKLACAACHGNIAMRATPPPHPLKPVSMENCLTCHRQKRVSTDCARCHK